ncbi:hypothetical protein C8R46DRAFT_1273819 [Mycena filopes]|nr:hypothetical protein C8R46DRAFT_1273819 [Mycena filopes]
MHIKGRPLRCSCHTTHLVYHPVYKNPTILPSEAHTMPPLAPEFLESSPLSHHKYELPARNKLLPPFSGDIPSLLTNIEDLMFAMCYRVEDYINLTNEHHLHHGYGIAPDPAVWAFFHEVLELLPRTLDYHDIEDARLAIYEALHNTERAKPLRATEQVNPGADPEPALTVATGAAIGFKWVAEGNPAVPAGETFTLTQNALAGTDLTEYVIEFVPDEPSPTEEAPGGVDVVDEDNGKKKDEDDEQEEEEEEEEEQAPKPKPKAKAKVKAGAKGGKKGKKVAAPKKKTVATTAPAKEAAAKKAARTSSRLAAKDGGDTLLALPAPTSAASSEGTNDAPAPAPAPRGWPIVSTKTRILRRQDSPPPDLDAAPTPAPTPAPRGWPILSTKTRILRRQDSPPPDLDAAPTPAPTPAPRGWPILSTKTRILRRQDSPPPDLDASPTPGGSGRIEDAPTRVLPHGRKRSRSEKEAEPNEREEKRARMGNPILDTPTKILQRPEGPMTEKQARSEARSAARRAKSGHPDLVLGGYTFRYTAK